MVIFVHAHVLNIIDDMRSSNVLAGNYIAIYVWYICVLRLMIKDKSVLPPLLSFAKDALVMNMECFTPLDDPSSHVSIEMDVILMMPGRDAFVQTIRHSLPSALTDFTTYEGSS